MPAVKYCKAMDKKRKLQSNRDLKGVEYYLKPSFLISTFVFMAGLAVNFFLYIDRERTLNAVIDGVSILLLFIFFLLLTLIYLRTLIFLG